MSTFTLPDSDPPVKVFLHRDITEQELLNFTAFKNWLAALQNSLSMQDLEDHAFHTDKYRLREIEVQAVDWFSKTKLGFVKIQAKVTSDSHDAIENDENAKGKKNTGGWIPGAVFLRGGSVGMLIILQPDDVPEDTEEEKLVVLTIQPRVAAGSLAFAELPAGMIDDGSFIGKAAQEIKEEVGIDIPEAELYDMTELALSKANTTTLWRKPGTDSDANDGTKEGLQNAIYPSPGACDEYMPLFLHQKRMPRTDLEELRGKQTGLSEEGERITIKLVPLEDLWKEGARDAKALAALALYEGLRREKRLPAMVSS